MTYRVEIKGAGYDSTQSIGRSALERLLTAHFPAKDRREFLETVAALEPGEECWRTSHLTGRNLTVERLST
jgi:hypothetical protein